MRCGPALLLLALPASYANPATLQGAVRNAQGVPVAGVIVSLETPEQHSDPKLMTRSDAAGRYRFLGLVAGTYRLHATLGAAEASAGARLSKQTDAKTVDLILQSRDRAAPAFSDEPNFKVAGITDNTYSGGHGSDAIVRSNEGLAKDTASLSSGVSPGPAVTSQREQELRAALSRDPGNARLYHQLAMIEEEIQKPLEAVHHFERAAELDPSEDNLFDWGAELLLHRAPEAAAEVFAKGSRSYPASSRMLLGSAVALYVRGDYPNATQKFFDASDLDPRNPEPYLFLGKVQAPEILNADGFRDRLERFARLRPQNAWANYLYAACLWRARQSPEDRATPAQVKPLLEKAIQLDPKLAPAYLQLGIVETEEHAVPAAIQAFQTALEIDPAEERAHYLLAQAYRSVGKSDDARHEIELFEQISQNSARKREAENAELKRFVVKLGNPAPN